MIKKRKIGILLLLIGVAIPLVLFFLYVEDDVLFTVRKTKIIERKLTHDEIARIESLVYKDKDTFVEFVDKFKAQEKFISELFDKKAIVSKSWTVISNNVAIIPFKHSIGLGILIGLIGIGFIIFSFFPKEYIAKDEKESKIG